MTALQKAAAPQKSAAKTGGGTGRRRAVGNARPVQPDHEVVVVGAGFSGIGAGIRLKAAGIANFVILEKAHDLGGTWRDNHYPGIAVDITSFTYSFSFEQNPNWSRVFAPGSELQAYAHHCANKYRLRQHMRFNTHVLRMDWDETGHVWKILLDDDSTLTARFVITATGGLTQPKKPDIPGIEKFKGKIVHTARWDHDHKLRGERVGVIGTGATSVQLVPTIAGQVQQLDVYQRTPIWILPKPDREIPEWTQKLFNSIPATQQSVRYLTTAITELVMVTGVVYNKQVPLLTRWAESAAKKHIAQQVNDPVLREKLTPNYGFGCKRPSFSNEYLQTFNRKNVELITDSISHITENAIVTRDGRERPIDTLILATGFKVFEKGNLPTYEVCGRDGLELGAFWEENRFQAYEGATIPKFPNYFGILGPYSTSGASWFAMVESQVNHAMRCINEAHRQKKTSVEIRQEPHDAYFREILRRQQNTVFFNNNCGSANSYYFDKHGDAPFLRPSSGVEMWWHSRHFPLKHYQFN